MCKHLLLILDGEGWRVMRKGIAHRYLSKESTISVLDSGFQYSFIIQDEVETLGLKFIFAFCIGKAADTLFHRKM